MTLLELFMIIAIITLFFICFNLRREMLRDRIFITEMAEILLSQIDPEKFEEHINSLLKEDEDE